MAWPHAGDMVSSSDRSRRPTTPWLVVASLCALLCAGCGSSSNARQAFPTPGPGRTTYTNEKFAYSITYLGALFTLFAISPFLP